MELDSVHIFPPGPKRWVRVDDLDILIENSTEITIKLFQYFSPQFQRIIIEGKKDTFNCFLIK